MKRILIIGGYGQFGSLIAKALAPEKNIALILAGRNEVKAKALAATLDAANTPEIIAADIHNNTATLLQQARPDILIHTAGPFQGQDYDIARACIEKSCHYIDLADGRDFVSGIKILDRRAKEMNTIVCSGASSVPALSSAVIEEYKNKFKTLESIEYGISTAQKTGMGLATARGVMSYAGKPFKTLIDGDMKTIHGWQGLKYYLFTDLGSRPLGYCDIPDLGIFPEIYPGLRTLQFRAGTELSLLHLSLWVLSWPVRWRWIKSLDPLASPLLRLAKGFDRFGTGDSGFYMKMQGTDENNKPLTLVFELTARQGHGLNIPATPAILLAKKLAAEEIQYCGATSCIGFLNLNEILTALKSYNIKTKTERNPPKT